MTTIAPATTVDRRAALDRVGVQRNVARAQFERRRRRLMEPSYVAPPALMIELENGIVEGRLCVAFTSRGEFVRDTVRRVPQLLLNGYTRGKRARSIVRPARRRLRIDQPAVLVGAPTGSNYFHWMTEALAREVMARDLIPPEARVLVPRMSRMERETLAAVGVDEERVLEMDPSTEIEAPRLLVPSRGARSPALLIPAAMRALSRLADETVLRRAPSKRVLISRSSASRRRISNEERLADALRPHGFERVALETLTTVQQMELFSDAEVIVGLHGAGFTNLAFMQPGATVVELQPPNLDNGRVALFWNLASIMESRYVQIVCAEEGGQEETPESARDIVVDCTHLRRVLDQLLD